MDKGSAKRSLLALSCQLHFTFSYDKPCFKGFKGMVQEAVKPRNLTQVKDKSIVGIFYKMLLHFGRILSLSFCNQSQLIWQRIWKAVNSVLAFYWKVCRYVAATLSCASLKLFVTRHLKKDIIQHELVQPMNRC